MPLGTPYSVIIGPLHDFNLVNPDTGQWPHYFPNIYDYVECQERH
ncbi:MAG TPA: hypothetical protein VFI43_06595 [Nitrosospira sp.]|nr:hypothetical protein [Nitrosospira sp.]